MKGSAKGVQFETEPEQQELGTSKSVERDKTLVEVRPESAKEALSEETKEEVVETEPVLSKNKCSAETWQSFVKGNISSVPEFISMI